MFKRTKYNAIIVITGTNKQTRPTMRHGIIVFRKNITNIPIVSKMFENDNKTPRVDGSLKKWTFF